MIASSTEMTMLIINIHIKRNDKNSISAEIPNKVMALIKAYGSPSSIVKLLIATQVGINDINNKIHININGIKNGNILLAKEHIIEQIEEIRNKIRKI